MSNTDLSAPKAVIRDVFAVPVEVCEFPNAQRLNAELKATVLAHRESSSGVVDSNRYGWHSDYDFHRWPEPCVAEFTAMVKHAASLMTAHLFPQSSSKELDGWEIVNAWANVNVRGGHNAPHQHIDSGGSLSGFYYVDIDGCNDPSQMGRTIFEDRSGVARLASSSADLKSREYALVPSPGTMCIFPAAQMHYVEPNRTDRLRITIAFNLRNAAFNVLYYPDMTGADWWWRNFRGLMVLRSKIPEKLKALSLFTSYFLAELRRPAAGSTVRRAKIALARAEVDASSSKQQSRIDDLAEGPLAEKNLLV
ncbi:MAG TPA: putative 2OG-Fe(II) oxygenase [Alphaproteobacteria bacterium]|nr:putative 2OG-Fe(II) oxygenase [Alphaproteobacteria bacterium]